MKGRPSSIYCNTSGRRADALERIVRTSYNFLRITNPPLADLLTSYTMYDQPVTILERDLTAPGAVLDQICADLNMYPDGIVSEWKPGFLHTPEKMDGAFVGAGTLRSHVGKPSIDVQTRIKSVSSIGRKVYFEHGRNVFDSKSYIDKYGTTFEQGHSIDFPVASDDLFVQHGGGRCAIEDVHGIKLIFDNLDELQQFQNRLYAGDTGLQVYRVKDYINNPKKNGYQSLHMVLGAPNNGRRVFADVHMETRAMYENNEHGNGVSRYEYMQRRLNNAYLHRYGDCVVVTHNGLNHDALSNARSVVPRLFRLSPDGNYGLRCASNLVAFTDMGEKVVLNPTPMEMFHSWYSMFGGDLSPEMYDAGISFVRRMLEEDSNIPSKDYVMHDVDFDGKNIEYIYGAMDGPDLRFSDFKGVLPVGEELPVMHINLVTNK